MRFAFCDLRLFVIMRKNIFGRQFKRDTNERKALFKSLISSLILQGRIKTTEEKAKAIRGDADKIVSYAKKGDIARRVLQSYLFKDAVEKAISEVAPRFARRQGGYSRITRMGRRLSDNASMVLMEWVEGDQINPPSGGEKLKMKNEEEGFEKTDKKAEDKSSMAKKRGAKTKK